LVSIPGNTEDPAQAAPPLQIAAQVVAVTELPEARLIVIDVTVPKDQAAIITGLVATSRIAAYWDAE
jgi:hypothetical protein